MLQAAVGHAAIQQGLHHDGGRDAGDVVGHSGLHGLRAGPSHGQLRAARHLAVSAGGENRAAFSRPVWSQQGLFIAI